VWPLCAHWRRPRSGDPCNCCNEFLPSHACPPEGSECVIVSVQTQHLKDTGDCVTQFVWRSPTSGQGQTQKSERATGQSRFTLKNRRRQPGLLGPKSANSGSCDVEAGRRLPRGRFCSRFKISGDDYRLTGSVTGLPFSITNTLKVFAVAFPLLLAS
jgi:hypothetical protein